MKKDIDYLDCIGEGLEFADDVLIPSYVKGYRKLVQKGSVGIYYRYQGTALRYDVVLNFGHLGAKAPKGCLVLHYGFESLFKLWERIGRESEDEND
jgi:hypothetical protein